MRTLVLILAASLAVSSVAWSQPRYEQMKFIEVEGPQGSNVLCGSPTYKFLGPGGLVRFDQNAIDRLATGQSARARGFSRSYDPMEFAPETLRAAQSAGRSFSSRIKPCFGDRREPARPPAGRPGRVPMIAGYEVVTWEQMDANGRRYCDPRQLTRPRAARRPDWVVGRHTALLAFDISPEGKPLNVRVIDSTTGVVGDVARNWLQAVTFEPPTKNGRPIYCRGRQTRFNW